MSERIKSIETMPMLIFIDVANNNTKNFLTVHMRDRDRVSKLSKFFGIYIS
jgi:hypothetical protein